MQVCTEPQSTVVRQLAQHSLKRTVLIMRKARLPGSQPVPVFRGPARSGTIMPYHAPRNSAALAR